MGDLTSVVVGRATERLLGQQLDRPPQRLELGYGNDNWRTDVGGRAYVVKIAQPGADVNKVAAASSAYRLASATAAPVPHEIVFDPGCEFLESRIVRILEFLPGEHPEPSLSDETKTQAFFVSFGRAVAALHTAQCPAFASRVVGTPSFPTWIDYVEYRVPHIIERCRATGAFTEAEIIYMFDRAVGIAREVSDAVEPRLCHRDLYLDNVLIAEDGQLSAILDFDLAEAWDCCVDFVKPRSEIFPNYQGARKAFEDG